MPGLNSGEVRVAGSGAMWKAPLGTTIPTDSTTAWGTSFVNLGYATDGFKVTQALKTQDVDAWQTIEKVRKIQTELIRSVSFESIQSNVATLSLAYGGGTITATTGGAYSMAIPSSQLTDFILGIDWNDGTTTQRIILPRASFMSLPAISYTRTDAVKYGVELQAMVPATGGASMLFYGVDAAVAGS